MNKKGTTNTHPNETHKKNGFSGFADRSAAESSSVNLLRQNGLKLFAIVVLLAAFASSLWINFGLRASREAKDKTIGLLVDYDELKRIADGSYDIEFPDMLRKAALAGATGLVVRERILSDWEIAGDILVFTGGQLGFQLENQYGGSAGDTISGISIIPGKTYILTRDPIIYDQIFSLLEVKRRHPEHFEYQDYMGIATNLQSSERANLGLGFPLLQLQQAAAEGFQIIPRLRNWAPVSGESLQEVMRCVSMIPNLAGIGFNDQSLPGDISNPLLLDRYEEAMKPLNKPLISFEFYDQTGFPSLAARLDNNLIRAHAIAENELQKYTDFDDAMDRYSLAATERNIRYIYLRFQGLIDPAAVMESNMELIKKVREGLTDDGLQVGNPKPIPAFTIPFAPLFLLGAGVIAAGGWLLALVCETFSGKRRWRVLFIIMMVLVLCAWCGGLVVMPVLARKLFAMAGAVFFPSLGVVLLLKREYPAQGRAKRLFRAVIQLLAVSAFSLMGAMIMSALLGEPAFMLKVNGFMGVKVAHIVPLAIVPLILWLHEKDWYGLLSGTVKSSVKLWQLGVCFILVAGVTLYLLRTGNDSPEAVFGIELKARQMLDNLLGVRPRTTEFLIGHPMMLVLLYYGYRFNMFPVLMLGSMGQISLINTYAHIHTPLMISLQRSGHGLWSGMLIGVITIVILELILHRLHTVNIIHEEV